MKYLITEEQLKLIENNLNLKSRAKKQEQEKEEYINNILKGKSLKELEKKDLEFILNLQPELLREYLQKIYPKYEFFYDNKKQNIRIKYEIREKNRFNQIKDTLKTLNPNKSENELYLMMPKYEIVIILDFPPNFNFIEISYFNSKNSVTYYFSIYPITDIFKDLDKIIKNPFIPH